MEEPPAPPFPYRSIDDPAITDDVLAALRQPHRLDEFSSALGEVERFVQRHPELYWSSEQARSFDETILASLIDALRYLFLVAEAQHLLMRLLQEGERSGSPPLWVV